MCETFLFLLHFEVNRSLTEQTGLIGEVSS